MTRGRLNVFAADTDSGHSKVGVNVIAIWDDGTPVGAIEDAIKAAARKAVLRAREIRLPVGPPPGPPNPPRPPHDRPYA